MPWRPTVHLNVTNVLNTGMEVAVLARGRRLALLFFPGQVDLDLFPVRGFTKAAGTSASWVAKDKQGHQRLCSV